MDLSFLPPSQFTDQENVAMNTQQRPIRPPRQIKKLVTAETARDKQGNICKVTVYGPAKQNHGKVLMLVGATGSGKSTLINGFANYIYGVRFRDDFRHQLIGDEGKQSQAHSQTKSITAYTFPNRDTPKRLPFTLTIIDTPGYGDTNGIERDRKITKQIKEFFSLKGEKGIDHIDGVGFVIPASSPRLTAAQKYIFDSILSIFGNDINENIFLMVTFADGKRPQILDAIKEQNIEYQQMFKFNNSALLPDEHFRANNDDDDDDDDFNEMFWKMSEKSFQKFFSVFGQTQAVSLQLTREVLEERDRLECLIEGLQVQIRVGLSKVDQLHQEERILKIHEKDIETNKDFIYIVDEIRQRQIDISGQGIHVTNCLKCNITCHENCRIPNDEDKAGCWAMDNDSGNCRICPMNCFWNVHKNNPYRFEIYTEKVTKTSQELKKRYEEAQGKKTQKEAIMSGLEQDLETLHEAVLYHIINAKKCLERLDEIALRPNPLSELEYIDILIQSEEMEGKEGFLRRMEALKGVRQEAQVLSKIKDEESVKNFMTKIKGAATKCWVVFKAAFSPE